LLREGGLHDVASRMDELAGAGQEFSCRKVRAIHFGGDGRLLYKSRASASLHDLVAAGFLAGVRAAAALLNAVLRCCQRA
jgi:hypothetical protein